MGDYFEGILGEEHEHLCTECEVTFDCWGKDCRDVGTYNAPGSHRFCLVCWVWTFDQGRPVA